MTPNKVYIMDTPFERLIKNLKLKFPPDKIKIVCKRNNKYSTSIFETIFIDSYIYNVKYDKSTLILTVYRDNTLYFALIDGGGIDIASIDINIEEIE